MAMNKKEQAMLNAALEARDMARAMRWPEYVEPTRLTPPDYREKGLRVGWWFNLHTREVAQGCCSSVHHSLRSTEKTDSQGTGRFYNTKREAAMAMRIELTERYARELARVDRMIAEDDPA